MSVNVRIPAPLRKLTGGLNEVESDGATVDELLNRLEESYPGFRPKICDSLGKLHGFINVYVNSRDVRYMGEIKTPLKDGDKVAIVPAIAGG